MITIPLYIFLFIYLLFLALFFVFMFINTYHLASGGSLTLASFFVTFLLFMLAVFVLYETWLIIVSTEWRAPVTLFSAAWFVSSL
jgi:hypothetical protein